MPDLPALSLFAHIPHHPRVGLAPSPPLATTAVIASAIFLLSVARAEEPKLASTAFRTTSAGVVRETSRAGTVDGRPAEPARDESCE